MNAKFCLLPFVFAGLFATLCRGADVVRSEIQGQRFVADFYYTQSSTNKTCVLLLGGSEGGKPRPGYLTEFLATNGYPTLALAYFKEKGLPESLQLIPLEYFDEAVDWLRRNERTSSRRIVVIGGSRGAELALLLASTNPKIGGVIAISPSSVVWNGMPKEWPILPCSSWTLGGKPVPFMPFDSTKTVMPMEMRDVYKTFQEALNQKEAVKNASIKVEQIQGPVMLASGHDDEIWPAEQMADAIYSRLQEKKFKYKYQNLKYENAGHTLDERWMIGGTIEGNRKARIDFDEWMLAFLNTLN
jgi:esterase/lipase